ncbi:MAG: family 16 glycosylhydrolase [Pseudomonadota bacterium]
MGVRKLLIPFIIVVGIALAGLPLMLKSQSQPAGAATPKLKVPPRLTGGGEPFVDTFDSLNKPLWNVSHGWRNGEWTVNDWRRSQARFDGSLKVLLEPRKTNLARFVGGEVQSDKNYGHGYFEARIRAAHASGTVSGFFTYTGPPFGKPWDEIDVEILGAKPREVMFTYYRDGKKKEHIHKLDYDATKEFHTYGFDWQPEYIRWYIDGEMVHEARGEELPLPTNTQKLMMSLWGSKTLNDWVGPFDPSELPTMMVIECASYSPSFEERPACE